MEKNKKCAPKVMSLAEMPDHLSSLDGVMNAFITGDCVDGYVMWFFAGEENAAEKFFGGIFSQTPVSCAFAGRFQHFLLAAGADWRARFGAAGFRGGTIPPPPNP